MSFFPRFKFQWKTADIAAQWVSERVFTPQIDEAEREKRLSGWRRALERAMNWEEK